MQAAPHTEARLLAVPPNRISRWHATAQAMEFMQHAFEAFTEKSYCVVTLPHDSEEPALMANMTRLAPMPGASFPEVRAWYLGCTVVQGQLPPLPE